MVIMYEVSPAGGIALPHSALAPEQQRADPTQGHGKTQKHSDGDGDEDTFVIGSKSEKRKRGKKIGISSVTSVAKEVAASNAGGAPSKGGRRGGATVQPVIKDAEPHQGKRGEIIEASHIEQALDEHAVATGDRQPEVLSLQQEKQQVSAAALGVVAGGVIVFVFAAFMLITSRPYRVYGLTTRLVEEECDNLYDADPAMIERYDGM